MSRLPTTLCEQLKLDNQLCFALYSTSLQMTKVYKPLLPRSASLSAVHRHAGAVERDG